VTLFLTRYLMPVLYTFFPAPGTPRIDQLSSKVHL
jgi:hypothetical protein